MYSRTYASTYRVYSGSSFDGSRPDVVVVEDSNSGFEFFNALCKRSGIPCISAGGKSSVYNAVFERQESNVLVIADGAALGPEMELLTSLQRFKNIQLFLPESFEWLVPQSGLPTTSKRGICLRTPPHTSIAKASSAGSSFHPRVD